MNSKNNVEKITNPSENVDKVVKSFGEFIEAYRKADKDSKLTSSMEGEINTLISNIDKVKNMMSKEIVDDVRIVDVEYLLQNIFDNITYSKDENEYREGGDAIDFWYKIDIQYDKWKKSNIVNIKFVTDSYDNSINIDELLIDFKQRIKNIYFYKIDEYDVDGEYTTEIQLWR